MTGLFFGSFNPIHNGHLNIAEYILQQQYCEEIWFIISPQNPFKQEIHLLEENLRLKMVEAALNAHPQLKACNIEFNMPRPSYTIETLQKLSNLYPDKKFALIIGEDNLKNFHLWREYERIAATYLIYVYPRPSVHTTNIYFPNLVRIKAPLSKISSTEIRQMIREGKDISALVPSAALKLIETYYS